MPFFRRFVPLAVLALGAGSAWLGLREARARLLPGVAILPGVRVSGAALAEGSSEAEVRALVEERARDLRARRVVVRLEHAKEPLGETTLGELGVGVDVDRVVATVRAVGEGAGPFTRAAIVERARRGEIDVPLVPAIDPKVLGAVLARVKEEHDRPAVSARLDLERHAIVPDRPGEYVDGDAAIGAIDRLVRAASSDPAPLRVELPVARVPAHIDARYVASIDASAVLAVYETGFSRSGDQARRGRNIDVAAGKLDGLVLAPHELIGFNDVVGPRTEANGFEKSWEILKGEMKEGVGGGTCQVASTVHAAAFFAGLDIFQRLPHSRPSAYIPIGLDATVVYPVVDMKLRDPFDFPLVLHAKVEGNRLRVEVRGKERPARVSFSREIVKVIPYGRKLDEKPGFGENRARLAQHGIRGFRVKRERELFFADGRHRDETTTDFYPPTSEIYQVAPGFDPSRLPPLPADDVDDDGNGPPGEEPHAAVAASDLVIEEGRGAHAPSEHQANPPRKLTIRY